MADVTGAFLSGQQVAQAEREHAVALEESKLRQQILKHQVAGLQLEDKLRQRDLQKQQADLGLGQDAAADAATAAPSATTATPPAPIAAPRSLGDTIGDMARERLTGGQTSVLAPEQKPRTLPGDIPVPPGADATTYAQQRGLTDGYIVTDGQGRFYLRPRSAQADAIAQSHGLQVPPTAAPSGTPPTGRVMVDQRGGAPFVLHHEDEAPGTHVDFSGKGTLPASDANTPPRRDAVWLPPLQVPEVGIDIPGMWYSPRAAADEQARRAIALKRAEMPDLVVGPQAKVYSQSQGGIVASNDNRRTNIPLPQQYADALEKGDTATATTVLQAIKDTRTGSQSLGNLLLEARRRGDTASEKLITSVMQTEASARRDPALEDQRQFNEDMRRYSEEVSQGYKKHADAMKLYLNNPLNQVPETAQPAPEYTPPSFDEWRAQHAGNGSKVPAGSRAGGNAGTETPVIAKPSTGKTVTETELAAIAKNKGTTVDVQRARYKAGGYTIAK